MKRALHLIAALAVAALTLAGSAEARFRRVYVDIPWRVANTTTLVNPSRLNPSRLGQDKVFAGAVACTSSVMDLRDAIPPPGYSLTTRAGASASAAATWADTIAAFATVVLYSDTIGTSPSTLTATKIFVDYMPAGEIGQLSGGVNAASSPVNPPGIQVYARKFTSMGSKRAYEFQIPLVQTSTNATSIADTGAVAGDPTLGGGTSAPLLPTLPMSRCWRVRFGTTGETLGIMQAAALRVWYWADVPDNYPKQKENR